MNKLIMELKTDAMKDRHWRMLFSKLKIVESVSEVTLGTLWDKDLMRFEVPVRDIMTIARGELVLEEMVRAVKEYWNAFELELVKYQTKCKLIRGWDDLFTKLEEDLNNLASMKISPYYKQFESEIVQWDDKLQKLKLTLDTWIDV
jgi:dynein heavy chain 1